MAREWGIAVMIEAPFKNIGAIADASDEELERLKAMSEDDLLRSTLSIDQFAIVEATRRLRNALQTEERAIKRLTVWLVVLTTVLVILTVVLVASEFIPKLWKFLA
jgi:hypothetical protein